MNKVYKALVVVALFIVIMLVNPLKGISQVSDPSCDPMDPGCPIDGGVSLLIAAGIGIGARKAYLEKRKRNTDHSL